MLHIETLWANTALGNYNYLIWCNETKESLALDPCNPKLCLKKAQKLNLNIIGILNTHNHHDHIEGNKAMVEATGAPIIGPKGALIDGIKQEVQHKDMIPIGTSSLEVLWTPGHCEQHVSFYGQEEKAPFLFSGDFFFAGGLCRCFMPKGLELLYQTFQTVLLSLPTSTKLYCGHDYLKRNLNFTLSHLEPDNEDIKSLLSTLTDHPLIPYTTTLEEESRINPYLRLSSPSIRAAVSQKISLKTPSPQEIFIGLRTWQDEIFNL